MFDFNSAGKKFCVDATKETKYLGRLVNHGKTNGNLKPRVVKLDDKPHLVLFASRDIGEGEELFFDYNETDRDALKQFPFLKL